MPATEQVGCLCAELHLILRNTSKATDTSVVVFLSLKNSRVRERWRKIQSNFSNFAVSVCICLYLRILLK